MKSLLALSFVAFLSGCSSLGMFSEKPKAELTQVFIRDTTLLGTTLVFVVNVENPNSKAIDVKEVDYTVFIAGKELAAAKTEKPIHVPAKGKADIEVPLPIQYSRLLQNIGDIVMANEVNYRIQGSAKMSVFSIPFSKEGKVELR